MNLSNFNIDTKQLNDLAIMLAIVFGIIVVIATVVIGKLTRLNSDLTDTLLAVRDRLMVYPTSSIHVSFPDCIKAINVAVYGTDRENRTVEGVERRSGGGVEGTEGTEQK